MGLQLCLLRVKAVEIKPRIRKRISPRRIVTITHELLVPDLEVHRRGDYTYASYNLLAAPYSSGGAEAGYLVVRLLSDCSPPASVSASILFAPLVHI